MKWRGQEHLVNKAGHCNHVEDGHHFGVLQQKWFYLSTDENCWAKTPGDADKSGSLKTWRRSQLFWSSTASTGKLLWPLQRTTHLRISIESYQPPLTSVLRLTCKGLQWISASRWTSRTPVEHLRRPTWLSSSWTAAPWGCWPGWSRSPGWRRSCTEAWPGCPRTTAFFGVCCSLETNEMKNYFKTRDHKCSPWVTSFCSSTMLSVEQNVEGTMKENNSCSVPFIKSSRIPWMLLPAS